MRSLLKQMLAITAAGSLALLAGCGSDEKKPPATASAPSPDASARAAGAHASGEMPGPVVTTTPPVTVQEEVRTRCDLPDQRDTGLPFDYDEADLSPSDEEMLSALATCLGQGGLAGQGIRIVGHADPRGSDQYNMDLGMRRAVAVREYLFERGVSPGSIVIKSEGERDAAGKNEEGWAVDRRVEIEIATPEGTTTPEETPSSPDNPYIE
ncbi:MAG TPA: OmpA family protein [Polyangiaceae bacterium]|nr:OmpA family protein [Polyangiaceae bacterium]